MTDNEIIKELEKALKVAEETINRLQAENIHLLGKIVKLEEECEWLQDTLETTKAEAVKEFAGEFERSLINMPQKDINYSSLVEHIDNIVKEMVGDADG